MKIIKGKNGGFCFGVKRAVSRAKSLSGDGNYVLGEIIHNEAVVEELSRLGIKTLDSIDDVEFKKGDKVLIRTHGEPKSTFDKLEKAGVEIIDCTCPFVKEIQNIVQEHYAKGYTIAIIGNPNHPEIKGINGWCEQKAIITEDAEVLSSLQFEKLCLVVQTTYSEEKFNITKSLP